MRSISSNPRAIAAPGKLRIVGGDLRGSKLAVADFEGLRPTPDRVRETLFNWLAPYIAGAHCLDLFAGTGVLGIEALSRGAAQVDFIERDARLAQALRENLVRLRQESGRVRCADALAVLREPPAQPRDLVFLDPPFASNLWDESAQLLEANAWLASAALIYVESPLERTLQLPSAWQPHREGRAGAVRYALYRRSAKLAPS
ncbi:16S rRNA (guanine(966)-N(2))-methyltransferase RsmD [Rudaea sp.]|uniref:16S rRNA (guanine(966)-N(2))-methyltransferase RsmD n=1 Tax=Rudaea sp. TaxID=2136325 RepID=UPI002ED661E4